MFQTTNQHHQSMISIKGKERAHQQQQQQIKMHTHPHSILINVHTKLHNGMPNDSPINYRTMPPTIEMEEIIISYDRGKSKSKLGLVCRGISSIIQAEVLLGTETFVP